MDTNLLLIVLIAAIAVAVGAWYVLQQRKRAHLRDRFGPEYDRAVLDTGDERRAERELVRREERVESLELQPLRPEQRVRFEEMWRRVQTRFVDSPSAAIADADGLVTEVMQAQGYPIGDFDQRAADISVDHPAVVENYRAARAISQRNRRGEASTEDLRQAMVHYRSLFEDLLDGRTVQETEVRIERA
jgi:hypothetical protein